MAWTLAGNIEGPAGQAGPTGATGATGAAGSSVPLALTTSAASTLTLTTTDNCYVFTGSTSTWTLPAVSTTPVGFMLYLESRGTGAITLNRAGSDQIWIKSAVTTYSITAQASVQLICDGTYWNVLSTDLSSRGVGIVPVADGGTGNTTNLAATATKLATARQINGVNFDGSAAITVADSTKVAASGSATGLWIGSSLPSSGSTGILYVTTS